MDPHGPREPTAYRLRVNDTSDGEGAYKPGGQLTTLQLKGEVAVGEPDLVASLVDRGRCTVLVGGGSVAVRGFGEASARLVPGASAAANEGLCRGTGGLLLCVGKQGWQIPVGALEGREACG